jgi:2,3-bisphosphoglycerate-independent phosphoglycerate mutase
LGEDGNPLASIEDDDAVIFFNFRGDRPRELTRAFIEEGFLNLIVGQRNPFIM